ncbi:MAG: amidase family protein, partial [Solirubrobacterales bacterium]
QALEQADEADRRVAAGEAGADAPLLGVPIALKDVEPLAGHVTAYGTDGYDRPAERDGELTRRLRDAGAVFIGKTNMPELAISGFTEGKAFGITRNPWDPDTTPSGSSGGSGAAVAAGLCAGASASDGAGSIRNPAAFCNLFGLKAQRGRIPMAPDVDHWRGMSVKGCVTRTVLDTALFFDAVMARTGEEGAPPPPDRSYVEAARTPPGRLRVALSVKPVRAVASPIVTDEVKGAVMATGELLRSLGHEVAEADPRYGAAGNNIPIRYLGGIADDVRGVPHPERLERRTRGFGRLGSLYPERIVERGRRAAQRDAARINALFDRFDVLITPVLGEQPFEVGRWAGSGALRTLLGMSRTYCFAPVWNHTGQPAAAVPAGFDERGLPLSVQLVGRPNDEDTLISLAAQLEAERPWTARRPPVS